jgi:hypothetical protein
MKLIGTLFAKKVKLCLFIKISMQKVKISMKKNDLASLRHNLRQPNLVSMYVRKGPQI